MQEIADEAGINKSLLHYYYRTKEKLFGSVFKFTFSLLAPKMIKIFDSNKDAFEVIELFIENYLELIRKNPFIPMFILNEVNKKDTNFVVNVIRNSGIDISILEKFFEKEKKNGLIREDVNPRNVLVNIIGLCVFPVIGRPLLEVIVFEDNPEMYDAFLDDRKRQVTELIINSIKK